MVTLTKLFSTYVLIIFRDFKKVIFDELTDPQGWYELACLMSFVISDIWYTSAAICNLLLGTQKLSILNNFAET